MYYLFIIIEIINEIIINTILRLLWNQLFLKINFTCVTVFFLLIIGTCTQMVKFNTYTKNRILCICPSPTTATKQLAIGDILHIIIIITCTYRIRQDHLRPLKIQCIWCESRGRRWRNLNNGDPDYSENRTLVTIRWE